MQPSLWLLEQGKCVHVKPYSVALKEACPSTVNASRRKGSCYDMQGRWDGDVWSMPCAVYFLHCSSLTVLNGDKFIQSGGFPPMWTYLIHTSCTSKCIKTQLSFRNSHFSGFCDALLKPNEYINENNIQNLIVSEGNCSQKCIYRPNCIQKWIYQRNTHNNAYGFYFFVYFWKGKKFAIWCRNRVNWT